MYTEDIEYMTKIGRLMLQKKKMFNTLICYVIYFTLY